MKKSLAAVILAAGKGTRMNSKTQKILHEVGGKPMVQHVFDAVSPHVDLPPVMVVSPNENGVQQLFGDEANYAPQTEILGTGHATKMARAILNHKSDQVIVMFGDMPLFKAETVASLAQRQAETGAALVILTVIGDEGTSFGRIVRDSQNNIIEICEVAEAKRRENSAELLAIRELNAGVFCFDADFLWQNIDQLPIRQARVGQEFYLTDMLEIALQMGLTVDAVTTENIEECLGAGTRAEMVAVEQAFRRQAVNRWLGAGVTIVDPNSTYIDPDVIIGQDTIIWPNTYLQGNTVIGEDCVIGPNSIVRSAQIGDGCYVEQAVLEGVVVPAESYVEPFTHALPLNEDSAE